MNRTCVFLTQQHIEALAKLSKRTGLKTAEIIRRAIDAHVKAENVSK